MNKKLLAVAGVAVVVIAFVAFVVVPNLGTSQHTSFNVVEVYIGTWDLNKSGPTDDIDVKFKISIDFNGDGTYEIEKMSSKFNDTRVELAPFKLGGPIASGIPTFKFKVEVFRVASNEALVPMIYTPDGTTPINDGLNDVDAEGAWTYDATWVDAANENACKISYVYYVNFVS